MKIEDLSLWEAFYKIAIDGSFSAAAKKLNLNPPQLSKKITKLESELGVRLFYRSTRRLSLTEEARSILPHIKTLLEDYSSIEDTFQNSKEVEGTIRLTCSIGLANRMLAPILNDFCSLYPKVRFELDVTDTILDMIESQIDIAIRIQNPVESEMVYRKLCPNDLIFCASPNYLKKCKFPVKKLQDLHKHPLLMFQNYERCKIDGTSFSLADFKSSKKISLNSGTLMTELAKYNGGIAVRSLWDVEHYLKNKDLVQILPEFKIINPIDIYAVIPSRRLLAKRVQAFLYFLQEKAKQWPRNT